MKAIESAFRALMIKSDEPKDKGEVAREIRDLKAQEDMADWAEAMFWITLGGVIVTGIGVILVWITLGHTRTAALAAQAAVRQTERATAAAIESVKVARETGQQQTRPYAGIEMICVEEAPHTEPRLRIHIRNHGHSTAIKVDCRVVFYWAEGVNVDFASGNLDKITGQRRAPFTLFGGEMRGTSFDWTKRSNQTMFVSVSLTYSDILAHKFRTREVFRYITRNGGSTYAFETYGDYARAI